MLELPTDNAEILTRGFTALADFAGGLALDADQIDKERGVVIEEWRGRLGAGQRIQDKQLPLMFYGSRYAERLPIGKPEILRTAPAARLRAFYDTWYRPDRMAIVAVGDIDAAQAEQTIRSAFGPMTARAPAAPLPDGRVPLHDNLLVNVATDPELTASSVRLVTKQPAERQDRVGDYRRNLVERLFADMLNDRFSELARKPDAKFLGAGAGGGQLAPTVQTFTLNARVPDGSLIDGLNVLEIEARRVREHGFNQSELDRNKREMAASYEQAYNERDKGESGGYADEYVRHFLEGEPAPGIEYEYRLVQNVLPGITLQEVTTLARSRLSGDSRVVLAVQPEKPSLPPPSEGELRSALTAADKVAVTPWSDTTTTRALIEKVPEPARVESRRELANVGVTVVRFANGVEAWLKPTDFKNDQVMFTMYSLGGASLASRADFVDASLATTYVGFSGAGGLKALDLQRMLSGKLASASPFISGSTHGLNGSAAPADLETALQLLYQFVMAPGDDPEAFALMKRQLEASIANRGRSPGQVFGERLEQINSSNHYTAEPLTAEDIASLDRARMLSFYRARFANAADFTFFMVGDVRSRRRDPAARPIRRLAAIHRQAHRGVQGPRRPVPGQGRERPRREGTRAAEPDGDQLLRRSVAGSRRTGARRRRDAGPGNRAARHAPRGARPDLHGVGRPRPVAAAARGRPRPGELRRSAGEHQGHDRPRHPGGPAAAGAGPIGGSDVAREGIGAARLRNGTAAELLLDAAAAHRAHARPRSRRDPHARRAHQRGDAGGRSGGVQEVLPARPAHGGHADARAGRSSVRRSAGPSAEVRCGPYLDSGTIVISGQ